MQEPSQASTQDNSHRVDNAWYIHPCPPRTNPWSPAFWLRALFGFEMPLTPEEKGLCRLVYTEYLKYPDDCGDNWNFIVSPYGRDGWTHASIHQGNGGRVRVTRGWRPMGRLLRPAQFGGALEGALAEGSWWCGPCYPGEPRPSEAVLREQAIQRKAYNARMRG